MHPDVCLCSLFSVTRPTFPANLKSSLQIYLEMGYPIPKSTTALRQNKVSAWLRQQ